MIGVEGEETALFSESAGDICWGKNTIAFGSLRRTLMLRLEL